MIATGSYDGWLVITSIVVAIFASFTALDLAGRVRTAVGLAHYAWLFAAALAMGGGIWSMHFVGMLAFKAPMPVAYDVAWTVFSLLIAVAITLIAFIVVRGAPRWERIAAGGVFMGAGIVAMHYVGMSAMEMAGKLTYDWHVVALSAVIAVGAATVALRLALATTSLKQRWVAAIAMGVAVSGMHYCGMAAASFSPVADHSVAPMAGAHQDRIALAIAAATLVILLIALAASSYDRHVAAREAAALRASDAQFRAFYNRTPASMHSLDAAGRIQYVNDYWTELLGYRRDEVLGRHIGDFLSPASAERMRAVWPQFLALNELRQFEMQCVRRSGELIDVLVSARIDRDDAGRFLRTFAVLNDITERKRLEERLVHAQKMETVGLLTGGVAHDFNNLLTVIGGNLALLEMRLVAEEPVRHLLNSASRAVERGERLTQQLLAFSRRQRLQPKAFDLNELLAGVSEMLRATLGSRIPIELNLAVDLGHCFADPTQVEAAVLNLAINARDAMPDGGTLFIATELRAVGSDEIKDLMAGTYLVLEIRDTGHGMSEAVLERVLEPFYTTKEIGKGSGLGLSMVYGFARQSGGGLHIESTVGIGTTARIFLPQTAPRSAGDTPDWADVAALETDAGATVSGSRGDPR